MQRIIESVSTIILTLAAGSLMACGDSSTSPSITSRYTVTALLSGAPLVVAGLNNEGQVVGHANIDGAVENVLITRGTTTDLGSCSPRGINAQGVVACVGGGLWREGEVTPAAFPKNFTGSPVGVNDHGTVAGRGSIPFVTGSTVPCSSMSCAYIASTTRLTVIEVPTGTFQLPRIDNGADVVVFSWIGQDAPKGAIWQVDSTSQPYPCAGLPVNSSLRAVGGNHEVVGTAARADDPTNTDAIACRDGVMQSLGSTTNAANDISEHGLIVGTTDDGHGFLWDNGKLTILDRGLVAAGWRIVSADRVNDSGQVVATASDGSGAMEALLLTPR
jgi:hypothetical protein